VAKVEDKRDGVTRSVSRPAEGRVRVLLGGPDSDLRRALGSVMRAAGRRLGASGVFAAPVDAEVLQGAIRAAMSR
jgi:hypothetical protein